MSMSSCLVLRLPNATYEQVVGSFVATNAADVGKTLFVSFGGVDGNGNTNGFGPF